MKLQPPAKLVCPECKKPFEPQGFGHLESCEVGRKYVLPQFVTGHRLLVFGSRTVPLAHHGTVLRVLDQQLATNPDLSVIHGGARGMDSLADDWAQERGVAREVWRPQWKLLPPWLAPFWRNAEMAARQPQEGAAFVGPCEKQIHRSWSPHPSHGSVDMALRLKALDIPVIPYTWGFPGELEEFLAEKELQ